MSLPMSLFAQDLKINFFRPYDQSGIHVFETTKDDVTPFDGMKVRVGGNFTQQFQALSHSNTATPVFENETNVNELNGIAPGFNLATANLNVDVQLADGIRLNLVTYLSSRHHTETWVKGGYIQIDRLPMFNSAVLDDIMDIVTIKVGHMEINYGDNHFRRTDNGNSLYNPFVGNLIMDAFTTEIGAEVYAQTNGLIAMVGVTGGEIKGNISPNPDVEKGEAGWLYGRSPSILAKLGYDNQLNDDLRVRLTGSMYTTARSLSNTLYGGDRTGSRYYDVMNGNFTSGRFNPGFRSQVTAIVVNPFVKFHGLEVFGTYEVATGRAANEADTRTWTQISAEAIYRFLENESLFLGARYNQVAGELAGSGTSVSIDRVQVGGGWFVTPNMVLKGEYVVQNYRDFEATNILNGGQFSGLMIEAAVGF
ncbi:MAG: hypothetical protein D6722_07695 [Bacteroidetes bacterium]|nr:MAG: hypothetical protein D6722_07695 [Bacteroidota bacterium]